MFSLHWIELAERRTLIRRLAGGGRSLHTQHLQPGVPAPQRSVRMPRTLRRRSSRVRTSTVTRSRRRWPRSRCPMRRAVATKSASGHRVVWQVSTRTDVYRMPSASMSARVRHCWSACALSTAVGQGMERRACVLDDTSEGSQCCRVYTH